jgi:hypothetical protein
VLLRHIWLGAFEGLCIHQGPTGGLEAQFQALKCQEPPTRLISTL